MTVASTATTEFDIDTQLTVALQSVGLLNPAHTADQATLTLGRRLLLLELRALTNDGIILRARERVTVPLVVGSQYIDFTGSLVDTLSIEQGGIIRSADGTTDRPIELYSIEMYQRLPNKTISGVPNFYYPEKQSSGLWRVFFYPVPTADYPSFIVPRTRRLRDVDTGNLTIDLDDKYHKAVGLYLAAVYARSKGRRDLGMEVMEDYRYELARANNDETPRGNARLVADESPWD